MPSLDPGHRPPDLLHGRRGVVRCLLKATAAVLEHHCHYSRAKCMRTVASLVRECRVASGTVQRSALAKEAVSLELEVGAAKAWLSGDWVDRLLEKCPPLRPDPSACRWGIGL